MRISLKQVQDKIAHLNDITDNVSAPWRRGEDGKLIANVGTYVLSASYGAYGLGQLTNEGGGTKDIISRRTKAQLWDAIDILEKGMRIAKGERV